MTTSKRKIPMRTCVGCRTSRPKAEMLRVVRRPDGSVTVDTGNGKMSGRGAYICPNASCLEEAIARRALERALRTDIDASVLEVVRRGCVDA